MCKIHDNRPIEYYCEDDDMIICSRCVIVGDHKGHNISSIEDKVYILVSVVSYFHQNCVSAHYLLNSTMNSSHTHRAG